VVPEDLFYFNAVLIQTPVIIGDEISKDGVNLRSMENFEDSFGISGNNVMLTQISETCNLDVSHVP
jgi:hypothetical protein